MLEVYTGHKPGRPVLLLVISSLALAGALGGAWAQVQNRRALGPQVHIEGTPLLVRAPRGWVRDPQEPNSFILPSRYSAWGRDVWIAERKITFLHEQLPGFRSPAVAIAAHFRVRLDSAELTPARIGPFDGVQYVLPRQRRRDDRLTGDVIIRSACSPRGDQIMVLYLPLTELTHADLGLLDDVCAAVQLNDPSLRPQAADALRHAGFAFSQPRDWTVAGPEIPQVPGVYFGGSVEGVPAWSLQATRTFLAFDRQPRDVLLDFAATHWGLPEDALRFEEPARSDGIGLMTLHPARSDALPIPAAAALLRRDADAALIVARGADERFAAATDEALRQLCTGLQFVPSPAAPVLDAAADAGRALAARLATPEAFSGAWGMLPDQQYYLVDSGVDAGVFAIGRAARNRRPQDGYHGYSLQLSSAQEIALSWRQEADGVTYDWTRDAPESPGPAALAVRTTESRRAGEQTVTRTRKAGRSEARATFKITPAFVGLPAEELAESWVASQPEAGGAWLIQVSGTQTQSVYARLLRPLPPDENGLRRVLLQDDYDTSPALLAYDVDGQMQYVMQPGWRAERITAREANDRFPQLSTYIRLAFE